jgi:hypothetical protein
MLDGLVDKKEGNFGREMCIYLSDLVVDQVVRTEVVGDVEDEAGSFFCLSQRNLSGVLGCIILAAVIFLAPMSERGALDNASRLSTRIGDIGIVSIVRG